MRNKLQQAELRSSEYHEQLVLAESRLDRLNSRSIALVHGSKFEQPTSEAQPPTNQGVPDTSQSPPVSGAWYRCFENMLNLS